MAQVTVSVEVDGHRISFSEVLEEAPAHEAVKAAARLAAALEDYLEPL